MIVWDFMLKVAVMVFTGTLKYLNLNGNLQELLGEVYKIIKNKSK